MRFLSFLRRSSDTRSTARRVGPAQDPVSVESLRSRMRRRLIGAAVLVAAAVLLLPLVFESAPRPVSDQVAILMPPRDTSATTIELAGRRSGSEANVAPAAPLPLPTPATAPLLSVPRLAVPESGRTVSEATAAAQATRAAPVAPISRPVAPAPSAPVRMAAAPGGKPAAPTARPPAPRETPAEARSGSKPAQAAKDERPSRVEKPDRSDKAVKADKPVRIDRKEAEKPTVSVKKPAQSRVWVQVGAYAEAGTIKTVRQRVDKLGLKSQEQVVQTPAGPRTRVRLGPFASREEADRAAAKLRANGLGASVVTP